MFYNSASIIIANKKDSIIIEQAIKIIISFVRFMVFIV